jgi:hypothetical protein
MPGQASAKALLLCGYCFNDRIMSHDAILKQLSDALAKAVGVKSFTATLDRVQGELTAHPSQPQAWEPVPLEVLGTPVPAPIKSCWVFVLRGAGVFGAERHPNSHQRTIALSGSARFEVFEGGEWSPRPVDAATPGRESISIPPNTWHRITIGPEGFVSCSFHTVPADELIEETPVNAEDLSVTRERRYHAHESA